MRKISLFVLTVLFVLPFATLSQTVDISVNVLQAFSPQARLLKFDGKSYTAVDSSLQISQGSYRFTLPKGYQKGMYRVDVGKNIKLNFIVGSEPKIDINTVVYAPEDSLRSAYSSENNIFWKFQNKKRLHSQQVWLIRSLMDYYSDTSAFHDNLQNELFRVDLNLQRFAEDLIASSPHLLASKFIQLEQKPTIIDDGKPRPNELVSLWWGQMDLSNPVIIRTPALRERVWAYMEFYFNDDFHKEEQDLEFIRGVHTFLSLPMSIEVKSAIRDILVDGFIDTDYQDVYEYLLYTAFGDLEPLQKPQPKEKSIQSPRVKVGDKAYDFQIVPLAGMATKLSKVKADYKLVLFWSSWCPHCIDAMPEILNIYNRYKDMGFEIIGVSLDDDQTTWEQYIRDLNLNWINVRIPYALDENVYSIYDVHETPRMFLLSKDLEIISKPSTIRQLEIRLRRSICR